MTHDDSGGLGPQEEAALRRGMRDFVRDQAPPGPRTAGPVLLDRCHRARRRRRAARAGAAAACVLAVATGAVGVGQWTGTGGAAPVATAATGSTWAPAASGTDGPLPLPLPARTEDDRTRGGYQEPLPAVAVTGVPYPYNWWSHCGLTHIFFGGKVWQVDDGPVPVPAAHPDADGIISDPLNVPGYVTLLSPTTLRFDAPTYVTGVLLHAVRQRPPLCM
jgi:hypothetical protein